MNNIHISRVNRTKEEAKANYNKISKWYDLLTGLSEKKYRDAGIQKLDIQEGENVLEIGFGTGNCILNLAKSAGKSGRVYGIDISENMVDITCLKVKKAGLSETVILKCSDASVLPFEACMLDAVFISFTLELFDTPEIPILLNECKRVLKKGGRICIVAMSKKTNSGLMITLYEWFHTKFPVLVDCRPILLQKELEETGFQVNNASDHFIWGLPVEIVLAKKD